MPGIHSWRRRANGGSWADIVRLSWSALALAMLVVLALAPAAAAAQARSVLVLPVSVGDEDPAIVAARAETLATAIPSGTHEGLRLEDARRRFEEIGSSEPPTVTDSDIDEWLRLSREAVRHLARTDYAAAREMLLEAQRLSQRAAEELNREFTRAQQVLDTCLYDVRSYVEQGDPRAESRALECRRLVPRVTPSPYNHTPEVVELLARIDARLSESPPGNLRIDSDPIGCAVRLNGVEFGVTPFVSEDLAPGEYRAQVECEEGRRGRVHRIRLGEGTSQVRIDTRFDLAIRTDTVLRLAYPDAAVDGEHRFTDTLRIGELVGAGEVWLVADDDGVLRIDRVAVGSGRVLASVRAPASALTGALSALAAERSVDLTGEQPRDIVRWDPGHRAVAASSVDAREPAAVGGDRTAELAIGGTLGALGVVGFAGAFGLYEWRLYAGHDLAIAMPTDLDYLDRQQRWLDRQSAIWAVGIGSGLLASAALPLLLPEEPDVPWWSWVIGAAGVGVATIGAVEIATATPCDLTMRQDRACVDRAAPIDRGVVFLSMSAPLLTVPVVYLVRSALGSGASTAAPSVSVDASADRVVIGAGGSF
ncbi:MAG: PEGA domain-containing protein [Myxococcota bacterium]|nr:PEGA domain-containing protein [Myxococcota bacterium]